MKEHFTECCRDCGSSVGGEHLSLCVQLLLTRSRLVESGALRSCMMTGRWSMEISAPLREQFRRECGCSDD